MAIIDPVDYAYITDDDKWSPIGFGEPEPIFSYHKKTHDYLSYLVKNELLENQIPDPITQEYLKNKVAEFKKERQEETENWVNSPETIEQHLLKQPYFIRSYYESRLIWLRKSRHKKHSDAFLTKTVKKALLRLDATRKYHTVRPYKILSAHYQNLYPHLPSMDKKRITSLGNEIANRLDSLLDEQITALGGADNVKPNNTLAIYRTIALEVYSLRVAPPAWEKLKPIAGKKHYDIDPAFGALGRMVNADWWAHQLWRLRCDWREDLLRASNQVHKKAHPYISRDAFGEWSEQRKRNAQFFKRHDLEDENGDRVSLFDTILASVSNPTNRRNELMTRMQGVEYIAQSRGDVGVFFTMTCPSKYHASNHKGRMNTKWIHARPPQAQRYLSKLWANIGSKLGREGLRVYGFRVAEPHHDSTPHWHLLLFMHPADRKKITRIMHTYITREDNHELVPDARARFNVKKMDPRKGSATAYIAKYISKNIDGYALDGEIDIESGKPLKETAKFATAWASRYRIRQYQPIGQPPVTVWREMRKLSNQLVAKLLQACHYNKNTALLTDPTMDKILAAADVGCWATFIDLMGGVLIPREKYAIGITYEEKDEPNIYGEIVDRVYGIYSRYLGKDSKVCTRENTWKIVSKKEQTESTHNKNQDSKVTDKGVVSFLGGFAVPWSSVNNSPLDENLTKNSGDIDTKSSFDGLFVSVEKERVTVRGDKSPTKQKSAKKQINKSSIPAIKHGIQSLNTDLTPEQIKHLSTNGHIDINDVHYFLVINGRRLDGRKQKRLLSKLKAPVSVPKQKLNISRSELVRLFRKLTELINLTAVSTPRKIIARQLLTGKSFNTKDEKFYLRDGEIHSVLTDAGKRAKEQAVAAQNQAKEDARQQKVGALLGRVEKLKRDK